MRPAVTLTAFLVLFAAARADGPGPISPDKWDFNLKSDQPGRDTVPIRYVKHNWDDKAGEYRILFEFVRDLDLSERRKWIGTECPVRFRLTDEDDVVLKTISARFDGEVITKRGMKVRVLLKSPDKEVIGNTKKVTVLID